MSALVGALFGVLASGLAAGARISALEARLARVDGERSAHVDAMQIAAEALVAIHALHAEGEGPTSTTTRELAKRALRAVFIADPPGVRPSF